MVPILWATLYMLPGADKLKACALVLVQFTRPDWDLNPGTCTCYRPGPRAPLSCRNRALGKSTTRPHQPDRL